MRRLLAVVLAGVLVAAACTGDTGGDEAQPDGSDAASGGSDGLVPEADWRARQDSYLEWAASQEIDLSSSQSLMAHAEWARRSGGESRIGEATPADFADEFAKLEAFEDTSDFNVNRLITLVMRYGDELDPALREAIEERLLAFKYWWTEPTPPGVVDSQYYWTENHLIIFAADELIAGQMFPDEVFTNSGMTGREHMEHAKPRIQQWIDLRARFGFSEWLSNVYWMEDLMGVLLVAEFSDDPELADQMTMILDMMMVELASHLQEGTFGSTHGRSYMKDKTTGFDEDTFSLAKLVFDDTAYDYPNLDTGTLLAVSERYRPPEVARRIAASDEVALVRQRQSLPIDPSGPVDPDAEAPYGLTYEGEDALIQWWSMGAQFPWQMVPTSVETVQELDLFETDNFEPTRELEPIVESATMDELQELAVAIAPQVNAGLLSEAFTTTWRSPEVMLSSVQDWRPGVRSDQLHTWQATLDANALVFTNHPGDGVPETTDWRENHAYYTGEATIPRSAQADTALISIYSPQYESSEPEGAGDFFSYEPYTHAFFPVEHFDEVVERDGWVIGRLGDGYVALWSWRPTTWREFDPATEPNREDLTERFDLRADGGPDNVWITQVGRAADFGSEDPFADFVAQVTGADVEVTPMAGAEPCAATRSADELTADCAHTQADGFLVSFGSPTEGETTFGWAPAAEGDDATPPLVADGDEVPLRWEQRWDSPWASAGYDGWTYSAEADGYRLELDFEARSRVTSGP